MREYPIKWPPAIQIIAVLCIIGFVAAVLFPVFQKVHQPRYDYCRSNMKQLGLAYVQYSQDADDKFPQGLNTAGNGWAGQTYPYTKSNNVYQCTKDQQNGNYISYTENRNIAGLYYGALTQPAATIELYEFSTLSCDPSTPETVSATGLQAPQNSARHESENNGATFSLNFLMTDGHVKWLTPEKASNAPSALSPKVLPQGTFVQTFAVK